MSPNASGSTTDAGRSIAPPRVVDATAGPGPDSVAPPEESRLGREAIRGPGSIAHGRIDSPAVTSISILREDGSVDESLDPGLPREELLRIHRGMVLTRVFDVRMLAMQRQGRMGTFAPGYGQEATQIAQVYHLTDADWFVPSYRSFGAQIWRGWEMERLFLLWAGYFEGFAPPPGLRDMPFSIVIGSHLLPAVGLAMGMQYQGDPGIVMANFGDGALSQGAVAEAFNFAAVNRAPCVFCLENNGYAISMPVERQCAHEVLAQRGVGFGIPSIRADGNDVLAMITAMKQATDRARAGEGPTLIEAVTYRMGVHTTADDPTVYRRDEELEQWRTRDPIVRFEHYLRSRGHIDDAAIEAVVNDCEQQVKEARERFEARRAANPFEVFDFMFEELPPELQRQKDEYLARLSRKGIS
ncbi:MAG: pyruvate dehydrogenase (acetyl-transferring) E1 component subunit alpha [Planctomycetota bacterium]|jgi:pyruvate dehydrogenase E1 component alpha subunit